MFFPLPPNGVDSIIVASEADHSRQRRLVAHAFTDKASKQQEPIIQSYVNLLIQRLDEQVQGESHGKVDMVKWYNYTTFDVVADSTFGGSFHCLRDKDYNPWVPMAFQTMKSFGLISIKRYFPFWVKVVNMFETQAALDFRRQFFAFVDNRIAERLSMETFRPDFMTFIMRNQDKMGMSLKEMDSSLNSFMVAGSETSATMLSGTKVLLIKNPDKMQKLIEEVRGKFKTPSEITLEEVNKLPYMIAVINEGLRMYPPIPTGFPRVVPKGGDFISGHWVPEKVRFPTCIHDRKDEDLHHLPLNRLQYMSRSIQQIDSAVISPNQTPLSLSDGSVTSVSPTITILFSIHFHLDRGIAWERSMSRIRYF